jgi:UDP-2-acetamido-3-amino-2,3-dideoxy-glucuronate N-acetyltransferase
MKEAPDSVACSGGAYVNHQVADTTVTTLNFPNGVQAHIFVSWLHPFKVQRLVVIGDRQMAAFDDTQPLSTKLILYPHQIDWVDGRTPVARKAKGVSVTLQQIEPLQAECEHFVRCILRREEPLTNGESGVQVLRVLEAA